MKTYAPTMLTSNEAHTSASRIYKIIDDIIDDDPFIKKVKQLLEPPLNDLTVAVGRTTDSSYVKLLEDMDSVRDTRYIGLRDYCKAFASDEDPELAAAGKSLVAIFKELGWTMYLEGYAAESSLLQALISRLEKATESMYLTAIGATARLNSLKAAQTDFETAFKNKVDAKTKEVYPKIRSSRMAIARYLSGMLNYIDMMAEIDGGVFNIAASKIDAVITEFETMAKARQTRKESEKKKTTESSAK